MGQEVTPEKYSGYTFLGPLLIGTTYVLVSLLVKGDSFFGSLSIAIFGMAFLFNSSGFFYYENLRGKKLPVSHLMIVSAIVAAGAFIQMLGYWGNLRSMISMSFVIIGSIGLIVFIALFKRKEKKG